MVKNKNFNISSFDEDMCIFIRCVQLVDSAAKKRRIQNKFNRIKNRIWRNIDLII